MHYGVPGMKWGRRKSPTAYRRNSTSSKKKVAANKKAVKKTVSQMAGQTIKTSAKVAGYGAQVVARMMQNNAVIGTTGAMFDSIYDRH
jgi:hypothetical protein